MNYLSSKNILLGVTGGIAAYKAAELVRRLRESGATVRVVMTPSATEFITPLTLQALSGQPVHTQWLDHSAEAAMGHIELARWADTVLIAPATADFIARLVQGRADDLLAAVCLACEAPISVAPAMNRAMWENAATRDNISSLRARGIRIFGPGEGEQACGELGPGRMLEPEQLAVQLGGVFSGAALAGLRVLVTAGPTREPIDPVRFISNYSSGRMGFAVASAAREAGAEVLLISGPVSLPAPPGVKRIDVQSALEMQEEVKGNLAGTDIFIAAAAVADYRPRAVAGQKLKKVTAAQLSLELERNPDILAQVAASPDTSFTVGFAAETQDIEINAKKKRLTKSLDMIAANRVGPGVGFDSEENALHVFWEGGDQRLERTGKEKLARQLVALVAVRFNKKRKADTVHGLHAKDSA